MGETLKLAIWSLTALVGFVPTSVALWRALKDWRALDRTDRDSPALFDFVKEELIRETIILAGQVLVLAIAAISLVDGAASHELIDWLAIPLPALFGLLSYHSIRARKRAEQRLMQ